MSDTAPGSALELAMQELEPMEAPMWETAIGRASMVSLLFSVASASRSPDGRTSHRVLPARDDAVDLTRPRKRKEEEMQKIASGANPALELAMQELEPMDAPTWKTAIVSATAVSVGISIGITIT